MTEQKKKTPYRRWLYMEEALDILGMANTDENLKRVSRLFEVMGWEPVTLRTLPSRPSALWVRSKSLFEIEYAIQATGMQTHPIYKLLLEHAFRGRREKERLRTKTVRTQAKKTPSPRTTKRTILGIVKREKLVSGRIIAKEAPYPFRIVHAILRELVDEGKLGTVDTGYGDWYFNKDDSTLW